MRTFLVVFIVSSLLTGSVFATEESFTKAHELFTQFWNDALQTTKSDAKGRELTRKQAIDLPAKLEEPLTHGILAYLNDTQHPSATNLKSTIAKVLTAPMMGNQTAEGVADVVATKDNGTFFVVYTTNYCIVCSKTWLGEFRRRDGQIVLQSSTRDVASDETVHLALLPSNSSSPVILLYGVHLGDAHNRFNAEALSSDGGLHTVWSKMNLPQGQLLINVNQLILTYESALTPPFEEKREIYQIAGTELKLIHQSVDHR